ncbi:hypothetical protein BXZ70DRAFT_907128 [Cristinia sonorae]|uniref:F-box domain-containing protein n=1 Tax=Cristinia sonorae TaxID=1940300 RepID=A0A8K0UP41_9AGAR|nr:hypothetical protein BXZ70DRAFT_907128 [Cristinia sonorae]
MPLSFGMPRFSTPERVDETRIDEDFRRILSILGDTCPFRLLPADVFVDNIIIYLDVEDIIRLRMVNKVFLTITEEPSIWKRLLKRTTFPLPPLPPCSRYNLTNLTNLETERLITRAVSLDKTWRQAYPPFLDDWNVETYFHVNSMVFVPGGRYLIASVRDQANFDFQIVVYVLDHVYGLVPIAALPTRAKAYQLEARYLSVEKAPETEEERACGPREQTRLDRAAAAQKKEKKRVLVPGIAISFICSRPKNPADWQKIPDDYNGGFDMDIDVPFIHECFCVHVNLNDLEALVGSRMEPTSKQFRYAAINKGPPFRQLIRLRSRSTFGPTSICEGDDGTPYFAAVKSEQTIVLQPFDATQGAIEMRLQNVIANRIHVIFGLRILPEQEQILVVRRIEPRPNHIEKPAYSLALYNIPKNNTTKVVSMDVQPEREVSFDTDELVDIQIPAHDAPLREDHSFRGELDREMYRGRPITIFARTLNPNGLWRLTMLPVRIQRPPEDPKAKLSPYFYKYSFSDSAEVFTITAPVGKAYVLMAGAIRSIVYTISLTDISLCPKIVGLYRYTDDVAHPAPEQMQHSRHSPVNAMPLRELDLEMNGNRIAAMAWDETIGRLCMVNEGDMRLFVLDFGKGPTTDPQGRRLPLRLPVPPESTTTPINGILVTGQKNDAGTAGRVPRRPVNRRG